MSHDMSFKLEGMQIGRAGFEMLTDYLLIPLRIFSSALLVRLLACFVRLILLHQK